VNLDKQVQQQAQKPVLMKATDDHLTKTSIRWQQRYSVRKMQKTNHNKPMDQGIAAVRDTGDKDDTLLKRPSSSDIWGRAKLVSTPETA